MDRLEQEAERLAGAVWGHLVGDALGVPYEFRSAGEIREVVFGASGTHGQPPGTWSDDGALILALGGAPGALDMTLLPGKRRRGYSGPQWRDAAADARRLRDVRGAPTVLLLVKDVDLEINRARETIPAPGATGIHVVRHPVADMEVPRDRTAFGVTLDGILQRFRAARPGTVERASQEAFVEDWGCARMGG